jgi:hypothetical protein
MATGSAPCVSVPDASISWKTTNASNAADAPVPVATTVPSNASVPPNATIPTNTPVSTDASDAGGGTGTA